MNPAESSETPRAAIHPAHRELIQQGAAFVQRLSLRFPDCHDGLFVGLRADGSPSLYFGEDPVYQFNSRLELRRAYVQGLKLKGERGKLQAMEHIRSPHSLGNRSRVRMSRRNLDQDALTSILEDLSRRIDAIRNGLRRGDYEVLAEVPNDSAATVIAKLKQLVDKLGEDANSLTIV